MGFTDFFILNQIVETEEEVEQEEQEEEEEEEEEKEEGKKEEEEWEEEDEVEEGEEGTEEGQGCLPCSFHPDLPFEKKWLRTNQPTNGPAN